MPSRNPIVPNPSTSTTPRRSPRLLLQINYNPTTPNKPFNSKPSKSNHSTQKQSNHKSSESRSKSTNYTTGLRRSLRLNNGVIVLPSLRRSPRLSNHEVLAIEPNGKKPSNDEDFSGDSRNSNPGLRKSARGKGRNQGGGAGEAKSKENSVEHCEGFAVEEGKGRNEERVEVGVKRTRKRKCEEIVAKGWTKEQELALQRAYLAAKPSPYFWKNVSKMVPGKSQQECFDRIHGDHITPPQAQPRSRAKTIMSSPLHQFSISASKLLKPIDMKVRRSNFLKPKNYIAKKSVEKLLQRHLKVDNDHEGDIFSVLEPNIDFSTNAFQPSEALSTPEQLKENQGLVQSCTETSSSSHKKTLSRFSRCITDLVSPPVLKQVKNRVLHEKYINQLRCRDARRRVASARAQVPVTGGNSIQKRDVVKAAKAALVSEARDAINKFQQSQVNFSNACSSDEDKDDGVEYDSQ